jgi:hypothetical protein
MAPCSTSRVSRQGHSAHTLSSNCTRRNLFEELSTHAERQGHTFCSDLLGTGVLASYLPNEEKKNQQAG